MANYLVLRNGGWYRVLLKDIRKGESFKVELDGPFVLGDDDNPLGDDIYQASKDAFLDGSSWIVEIVKPSQTRWSDSYVRGLAALGVRVEVVGSYGYGASGYTGSSTQSGNVVTQTTPSINRTSYGVSGAGSNSASLRAALELGALASLSSITLQGAITGSGAGLIDTTIPAGSIALTQLQNIGQGVVGRDSGTGSPQILSGTQLALLVPQFSPTLSGLAPASGGGSTTFLRADGVWASVAGSSLSLGESDTTAYRGDRGKLAYDHSNITGNPHGVTKDDVGLSDVENTSDADKPVSIATQDALDLKQNNSSALTTLSSATAAGLALMDDATALDQRNTLGLGTASTQASSAFATSSQGAKADTAVQPGSLATVAVSGAYADLSGKPSLGTAAAENTSAFEPSGSIAIHAGAADPHGDRAYASGLGVNYATALQGSKADTAVQPGSLATVATSGAYSDLSGKPSLGTAAAQNTSAFEAAGSIATHAAAVDPHGDRAYALGLGSNYATSVQGAKADSAVQPGALATVATTGAYSDLSGKPTLGTLAALSSVTNTELAAMSAGTVKGRAVGAGSGSPTNLTGTQLAAVLSGNISPSDVYWINSADSILGWIGVPADGVAPSLISIGASLALAGGALTRAALTGDVTSSANSNSTTIAAGAVTLAKFQNIATSSFLGRVTGSTGSPEVLTATQATSLLNAFSSSLKGLVPASGGGSVNFLRADGSWATPANVVTVEADFGYSSGSESGSVVVAVSASWVTTASILICCPSGVATADHEAEDAAYEEISAVAINIVNGVGFDLVVSAPNGTWGRHSIRVVGV